MDVVHTQDAPEAIGTYSQAIRVDRTVYISGQIPLFPQSMRLVGDDIEAQIHQVFKNLRAVCIAAGGDLANIVKINIFLTDLAHFTTVNDVMSQYFNMPYPARAAVEVSALPKSARVEADAVMVLSD